MKRGEGWCCESMYVLSLGKRSWLTTMLWVSISYAVSSWTRRSVSYNDKNSEMHTQMKVVFSCLVVETVSFVLKVEWQR